MFATVFFPTGPPFGITEFILCAALAMLCVDDSPVSFAIDKGEAAQVASQVVDKSPPDLHLLL
jgi:hypothetical protein